MKKRCKLYLKINLTSLFFIVVSSISVTLAWFAYTGMASVGMEVDIQAWYIEFEQNNEKVSNEIKVSVPDIYPGMETKTQTININNLGDSNADLRYAITSVRILDAAEDNYIIGKGSESNYVEDILSHNYPFHININLSKGYVLAKGDQSIFEISISWPLDSGRDYESNEIDSIWGNKAYLFQKGEFDKKELDENYTVRPAIDIAISVTAEQYLGSDNSSDTNYYLGKEILFDVVNNQVCTKEEGTCLKNYVIDTHNKAVDENVTLLPKLSNSDSSDIYSNYDNVFSNITNSWNVTSRPLVVEDLVKIISTDITNSLLIRDNISDVVIGNLNYGTRLSDEINKTVEDNGYYKYNNQKFNYLVPNGCYFINSSYGNDVFAFNTIDEQNSKIYNLANDDINRCKIIPVISIRKCKFMDNEKRC